MELRLNPIIASTAQALLPDLPSDSRFAALIDASISLIRGVVMAIPVSGRNEVEARWTTIKPLILDAAAELLDSKASARRHVRG